MHCLSCGYKNPATVAYCQRCGQKLALTADEIRASLHDRVAGERRASAETNARQLLFFVAVVFLLIMTLFFTAGSAPEGGAVVPSASLGARYADVTYRVEAPIEKMLVPVPTQGK